MEKTREECLKLVKEDIKCKHSKAWTLLCFAVLFSIVSAAFIAYYTFNGYMYSGWGAVATYALMFILSTFSIGYISAFIFYYYHDYLSMASEMLEDYQIAYAPVKIIYQYSKMIEKTVFEDKKPSDNYDSEFADSIIVEKPVNGIIEINPAIWKMMRLNSSMIKESVDELKLVRSDLNQITFITLSKSLDIYHQLSEKNWALENDDNPNAKYEDLKLVLRNYKQSLEDYQGIMLNLKRYVYFDIEKDE
ncbi:hypothetical protein [Xylanibacter ruminicola]|uniref:hypothetical protein n=1 Tax=Xylanibacter ruminicola TaxID=839 RepID=UPI00048CA685|nr:hypothetical protein [Xylanibacter ruminicola]